MVWTLTGARHVTEILHNAIDLGRYLHGRRAQSVEVGFVATMGALHAGHGALFDAARRENDVVIASIFVNPTQFNEVQDYANYPRHLDADVDVAAAHGVDALFVPSVEVMYPEGSPQVSVDPGPLAEMLEGASRPGHFRGVATVVHKLFGLVAPERAYFGEKDYQQLTIVRAMVRDLFLGVAIVGCATVRERDGLALSSRNVRLDSAQRRAAPVLYRALERAKELITAGEGDRARVEKAMVDIVMNQEQARLEYAVIRRGEDLSEVDPLTGDLRLLIAARFGPVRLIDNLAVLR